MVALLRQRNKTSSRRRRLVVVCRQKRLLPKRQRRDAHGRARSDGYDDFGRGQHCLYCGHGNGVSLRYHRPRLVRLQRHRNVYDIQQRVPRRQFGCTYVERHGRALYDPLYRRVELRAYGRNYGGQRTYVFCRFFQRQRRGGDTCFEPLYGARRH